MEFASCPGTAGRPQGTVLPASSTGQPTPTSCDVDASPVTSCPGAAASDAAVWAGAFATLVTMVHGIDVNEGAQAADAGAAATKAPALAQPMKPATMRVVFTRTPL